MAERRSYSFSRASPEVAPAQRGASARFCGKLAESSDQRRFRIRSTRGAMKSFAV
jgi:hypothetical protein